MIKAKCFFNFCSSEIFLPLISQLILLRLPILCGSFNKTNACNGVLVLTLLPRTDPCLIHRMSASMVVEQFFNKSVHAATIKLFISDPVHILLIVPGRMLMIPKSLLADMVLCLAHQFHHSSNRCLIIQCLLQILLAYLILEALLKEKYYRDPLQVFSFVTTDD